VAYNEEGLRDITTKYEGWIEKLYVNRTWTVVKAGDPLFEIYSPDLYNAQLNFSVALQAERENPGALSRAALARLQLFDVPEDVIEKLKTSGEIQRTMLFRAPTDGVVIEKMAIVGQMMKPGEQIYRMADLSTVWVQAQVYEKDFAFVREGQAVDVHTSYGPERKFEGTVDLLLPQVEEQTRTISARIVLPNPDGFLRPGMYVDVSLAAQLADDAVLVPDIAVLRSGERNTVFIALDGGFFEPREVKLGVRSAGNFYEVKSGLSVGERVVTSGQFMLDSESQLREAIQKMLRNESGDEAPAPATPDHAGHTGMADAPGSPDEHSGAADMPAAVAADPSLLTPLAVATADAAAALATDDLAGYTQKLPPLRDALAAFLKNDPHAAHGVLEKFRDGLATPGDLETARRDFIPLSTAVADLALASHLHHTTGLHIFECAMAPGRWIQRTAGAKNPFYGSAMSTCGTPIEAPSPSGAHGEPHASMSAPRMEVASLLRDHLGRDPSAAAVVAVDVSGAESTCGSCGMTDAEMAAGAECAHAK
jgi:multidrug efflux pump subunit AcrA (membrane-fusion protein)